MGKFIDLTGRTFGRLIVIGKDTERTPSNKIRWVCRCTNDGNITRVTSGDLNSGKTKSCGCLKSELTRERSTTHGMSKSPEYGIWNGIITRCYNSNATDYPAYGGLGIGMSDDWRNSFEAFYRDMGPRPTPAHSIDRIDNDGEYCKENCRWATPIMQASNKDFITLYEFNGESLTLTEIGRRCGISGGTIRDRISKGMSFEDAISKELQVSNKIYHHDGHSLTIEEWAEKLNISKNTLYGRILTLKMPISEALSKPVGRNVMRSYTYNGETLSIQQWSTRTKIPYDKLYYRLVKANWTIEEALEVVQK